MSMSITSPTTPSPGVSLLEWDEPAVQSYLSHIGLSQYEHVILEHGITGDVLAMLDHESLLDLGMASLGHRLNLLRAVWELKQEQGILVGEDDWRPQEYDLQKQQAASVDHLRALILEQQDRLISLERDHARLLLSLEASGIHVPPDHDHGLKQSAQWRNFDDIDAGPSKVSRRASALFPSTSILHASLSSDCASFQDSFTPTAVSASYPFDSPSAHLSKHDLERAEKDKTKPAPIQPPPITRLISGTSILGANASSPIVSGTPPSQDLASGHSTSSKSAPTPASTATAGPSQPHPYASEKSKAKDEATKTAKSFRVTLDDPCWKVLPAALKKYRINDDWKYYALFICFENTERCLSYDEKPLLLFQKIKESGHKPVFMLRHIKDVKPPIEIAQMKQAEKIGVEPSASLLPQLKTAQDQAASPTKATALKPTRRNEDGQTPAGGAFPELPSPGLPLEGAAYVPKQAVRTLKDKDGNTQSVSYAVSIYPYIADRLDEFDVAVGSCYVIISKAKGWYIVQRDPHGMGNLVLDQAKSGWVPAGCILELQAPIGILSPLPPGKQAYPGLAPLPNAAIMSSSYPGIVLMSWQRTQEEEVSIKEGEKVRVYKKYCHWSYVIKNETGDRGWVPAWFIGKAEDYEHQPSPAAIKPSGGGGAGTETGAVGGGSLGAIVVAKGENGKI